MSWAKLAFRLWLILAGLWIIIYAHNATRVYISAQEAERSALEYTERLDKISKGEAVCDSRSTHYSYEMLCTKNGLLRMLSIANATVAQSRIQVPFFYAIAAAPFVMHAFFVAGIWLTRKSGAINRLRRALSTSIWRFAVASSVAWAVFIISISIFQDSMDGDDLVFLLKLYFVPIVAGLLIALVIRWALRKPLAGQSHPASK